MDQQLQSLKRCILQQPDDVSLLHRYVASLERALGGVQPADVVPPRRGWACPDSEDEPDNRGPGSPDGICVYHSEPGVGVFQGRRVVQVVINGQYVNIPLGPQYTENVAKYESEDWCIYCGNPEERK